MRDVRDNLRAAIAKFDAVDATFPDFDKLRFALLDVCEASRPVLDALDAAENALTEIINKRTGSWDGDAEAKESIAEDALDRLRARLSSVEGEKASGPSRCKCPVCGRDSAVTPRGCVWAHRTLVGWPDICPGSGRFASVEGSER